ncbi:hypothetical protein DPMN_033045 [Dreissena polymorpha]|uniref:Uncharacterized protein n=1 Tax=Dreissena polymorpha TaxID=45954 RepID=A0A9D4M2Y3_DREPO|nr:hypothetical protein DPMN_033045 [Dreissena polymorpha]
MDSDPNKFFGFVAALIIIFELIQDIIETNLLTKFHEDWIINVASRVLTSAAPCGHVFKATKTIFKLIKDIIGTNLLTKFYDDRKINVTSRVLTRKNAPPLGGHTNLLTIFHQDWTINVASRVLTSRGVIEAKKNAPPPSGHVFQQTSIIFKLVQDIIGLNLLTRFHKDWTINVASRVNKRSIYSHLRKNAPPLGSHVFQANVPISEFIQDIFGTNLLTKFHEDWK